MADVRLRGEGAVHRKTRNYAKFASFEAFSDRKSGFVTGVTSTVSAVKYGGSYNVGANVVRGKKVGMALQSNEKPSPATRRGRVILN